MARGGRGRHDATNGVRSAGGCAGRTGPGTARCTERARLGPWRSLPTWKAWARRGDRLWLVASHDAGLGTERRPERQRLFALGWSIQPAEASAPLSFTVEEGPTTQLIEAGQWASQMYGIMVNTEGRTSTDPHGLSIEALAVAHDDALLLGFRAPVHAGRALVQRLESPVEAARGGAIAWTGPRWLTLDGRGIRALAMDGPDAWRLVAGPGRRGGGLRRLSVVGL